MERLGALVRRDDGRREREREREWMLVRSDVDNEKNEKNETSTKPCVQSRTFVRTFRTREREKRKEEMMSTFESIESIAFVTERFPHRSFQIAP